MTDQFLIRVAIGGGHWLDRAGIAAILANLPGFEVVSPAADPPPRVFLWDMTGAPSGLPNPVEGTALLLLVTGDAYASFPAGADGLFSKDEPPEALGVAIRQVARGQQYLSPALAISILRRQSQTTAPAGSELAELSEREREVFDLLAQGLSNKAIAARLYLSVRTVEGHLERLYARLGVHSRTEAVALAMRHIQTQTGSFT